MLNSLDVDENYNSVYSTRNSNDIESATENIKSKTVVDQSEWNIEIVDTSKDINLNMLLANAGDEPRVGGDIPFFNENDLLDIAKSWAIYDPNCPTSLNNESIGDAAAQLLAGGIGLDPIGSYSSVSVNLGMYQ